MGTMTTENAIKIAEEIDGILMGTTLKIETITARDNIVVSVNRNQLDDITSYVISNSTGTKVIDAISLKEIVETKD